MELRDLVLSTLEELDERLMEREACKADNTEEKNTANIQQPAEREQTKKSREDEVAFLKHTKERLEVLFQGLRSPEIKDGEAKLELTLKYLQLLLAQVDARLAEKS